MKKKRKPIKIDEGEPINVYCPKCNCWLARVNAVKVGEGYICISCYRR